MEAKGEPVLGAMPAPTGGTPINMNINTNNMNINTNNNYFAAASTSGTA